MEEWKRAIDQVINEARTQGKFDDLEGKGKPLVLDTSPDAVIKNLLKNANVVPDWISLAAEIEKRIGELDDWLANFSANYEAERAVLEGAATARSPETDGTNRTDPSDSARSGAACLFARLRRPAPRPAPGSPAATPSLAPLHQRWDAALAAYASQIHRVNHKIRRYNRLVPITSRQRLILPVAERLQAFVDRFPRCEHGADGALRPTPGVVPDALLATPPDPEPGRMGLGIGHAAALHSKRRLGRRPPPIG